MVRKKAAKRLLNVETITGKIENMSQAFKNGWRILSIAPGVTATGCIPGGINLGDNCSFKGKWQTHPKYGKQFKIDQIEVETPKDVQGIQDYLMTHFRWIGPYIAKEMVNHFGENLFDVMKHDPLSLTRIPGITEKRAAEIFTKYTDVEENRQIDIFFSTHGVTLNMQSRLVERYGSKEAAFKQVREDPYALADELWGVGFKKADAIAISMGIEKTSPRRIEAGIMWVLKFSEGSGHCFLPEKNLTRLAVDQLGVDGQDFFPCLEKLYERGELIKVGTAVYASEMLSCEEGIASKLLALVERRQSRMLKNLTQKDLDKLDEDQHLAVGYAINANIQIITGNPGVGKTYTIKTIIEALGEDCRIALAAPTGKAAKRMEESTGKKAKTIHRLLEYDPFSGGFSRNGDNPLDYDTLIIDEVSMIDVNLMYSLLDAIHDETQLILVGDKDQLPSVGPGAILRDMIESEAVPVVFLKTLHRQAKESTIVKNAHLINKGKKIIDDGDSLDFHFIKEERSENIPAIIKELCNNLMKKWMHSDIQVLCPMKKGPIGTKNLNDIIRPVFNPGFENIRKIRGTIFYPNDRVIQIKNNYKLGVFNGDIGFVSKPINNETFIVDFNGNHVEYPISSVDELQLAYALTIHKFQGSESQVVIIPVHTTNFIMLKRNLLYTGITRGKKLVILVGTAKAVNIAIRTTDSSKRFTGLKEKLKGEVNGKG